MGRVGPDGTAGQDHTWKLSNTNLVFGGGTFLVRAEYKANTSCGGKTQYDTHYGPNHLIPAGGIAYVIFSPKLESWAANGQAPLPTAEARAWLSAEAIAGRI